jgi:DNA-binding PadR family transcriptional regulator
VANEGWNPRWRAGPAGDITRLTLLGLLASKPMHGYELRQQMKQLSMEHWVDIQPGSIYSALPRMAADGFLSIKEVSHEGNRPSKTVYQITDAGRAELVRLLSDAWARPAGMAQPVDVALFFMWFLPQHEIADRLVERLAVLDGALAQLARNEDLSFKAIADSEFDVPRQYVAIMTDLFGHAHRILDTERAWSDHTLKRVQAGTFNLDSPTKEEE